MSLEVTVFELNSGSFFCFCWPADRKFLSDFGLPVSGSDVSRRGLHFSAPFQNNDRNSQENTSEENQQERQESQENKLNYSPEYCD
jgi:hypothetical protein